MAITREQAQGLRLDEEDEDLPAEFFARQPAAITRRPLSAVDLAAHLLARLGTMDTFRLQKLIFYMQARHVAAGLGRLFSEDVVALQNGPVVMELLKLHGGKIWVSSLPGGDAHAIDNRGDALDTVDAVLADYGHLTGEELVELTHEEAPWVEAWAEAQALGRKWVPIPLQRVAMYYRETGMGPEHR